MRITLSARDAAAAAGIAEVSACLHGVEEVEASIVAAEPAAGILFARGLAPRVVPTPAVRSSRDPDAPGVLAEAERIICDLDPDVLLVGLSGPDLGIDEALLARAGTARTFALQDFWGDVNAGFGVLPERFLVVDDEAARLTEARSGRPCTVVGSVRHAGYGLLDPPALRRAGRAALGVTGDDTVVVFMGQPLEGEGYRATAEWVARAAEATAGEAVVVYRPHPRELPGHRARVTEALNTASCRLTIDPDLSIEVTLASCDVLCSCYSATGFDLAQLNRVAEVPMGVALYLMVHPDIRANFRNVSELDSVPLVKSGLALETRDPADLSALSQACDAVVRRNTWMNVRRDLPDPTLAAQAVVGELITAGRSARRTR